MNPSKLIITESTTIARPITEVFSVLTEPRHSKHWISLVFDADLMEPKPIAMGTTAWYMVKLFGRRIRIEGQWLRYEPPFESVFESTVSPLQLHVTYRCKTVPEGTYAEIIAVFGSGVFLGVTANIIKSVMSNSFAHDLTLFKTYMEMTPQVFNLVDKDTPTLRQ